MEVNMTQLDTILQRMRRRDISTLCRIALSKALWRDVCLYSTVLWNPPASAGRWALLILTLTMSNARWRHQAACDRFSYSNDVSIVINLLCYVTGTWSDNGRIRLVKFRHIRSYWLDVSNHFVFVWYRKWSHVRYVRTAGGPSVTALVT